MIKTRVSFPSIIPFLEHIAFDTPADAAVQFCRLQV
jgi:hypothetical protein